MRHGLLKDTIGVENDPIGTGVAARVGLVGPEDGKLLIRAGIGKAEAFIVIEGVRIVVAAHGLLVAVVVAALVHGVIDIRLPVAHAPTGVDASLALCNSQTEGD